MMSQERRWEMSRFAFESVCETFGEMDEEFLRNSPSEHFRKNIQSSAEYMFDLISGVFPVPSFELRTYRQALTVAEKMLKLWEFANKIGAWKR